ncbi:4Fe-4S dicluster domain-containing protein [Desulfobacula sp.]|uniref:4Fe-4S dicluster domain-containing protein n=1 Tax=Desulfobacula sp. TaxID=2593537 RepID=UPI002634DA29|nr:4Fe-4S dicluster domain-containing protein [Desulfobacula sp.]
MKWSEPADQAIHKIPFFIRKKVKKKVEAYVAQKGKSRVDLSDVTELKKKFLSKGGMEKAIKGYEVMTCFGGAGCPNTANACARLAADIENIFEQANILAFLKAHVKQDVKFHHEFRVALADCPNACSRPQIVDIGIIGSVLPGISHEPCSHCNACVDVCGEAAIRLDDKKDSVLIDDDLCLMCARCISVCPTGTLREKQKNFRVMLGGRLGRHPRLAMEVAGLHTHDQVLQMVKNCLEFYKKTSKNGQRFAHLLSSPDQVINTGQPRG